MAKTDDTHTPGKFKIVEPFDLDEILGPLTALSKPVTPLRVNPTPPRTREPNEATKPSSRTSLLDVPPEVRQYIFEQMMADEVQAQPNRSRGDIRLPPCQPPITKVCRVIREEALEVWWRFARIPIQFSMTNWIGSRNGVQGTPNYEMLDTLSPWVFPKLRNIELCFTTNTITPAVIPSAKRPAWFCLFVDLDKAESSHFLTCRADTWDSTPEQWRKLQKLHTQFDLALTDMLAHGRIGFLTHHDYQRLVPQSSWGWWEP